MTGKIGHPPQPPIADAEAVEGEYGDLGAVYAETRSQVAKSLGREKAASKWREVELEIKSGEEDGTAD